MGELSVDIVDDWVGDGSKFVADFIAASTTRFRTVGIDVLFIENGLLEAHASWVVEKRRWENELFATENHNLAEIKSLSILLWALIERPFIREINDFQPNPGDSAYEFKSMDGLEAHRDLIRSGARSDFLSAPETICALDFCLSVINAFEEIREDRQTAFDPFITPQFRHNFIVYLKSGHAGSSGIYTILEGYYSGLSRP